MVTGYHNNIQVRWYLVESWVGLKINVPPSEVTIGVKKNPHTVQEESWFWTIGSLGQLRLALPSLLTTTSSDHSSSRSPGSPCCCTPFYEYSFISEAESSAPLRALDGAEERRTTDVGGACEDDLPKCLGFASATISKRGNHHQQPRSAALAVRRAREEQPWPSPIQNPRNGRMTQAPNAGLAPRP